MNDDNYVQRTATTATTLMRFIEWAVGNDLMDNDTDARTMVLDFMGHVAWHEAALIAARAIDERERPKRPL
jgi:hypothetical protein